jgi:hypothetical protein
LKDLSKISKRLGAGILKAFDPTSEALDLSWGILGIPGLGLLLELM